VPLNQVLVLVLKLRVKTFVSRLRLLARDAIPTATPLETGLDCALETPDIGLEIIRIVFRLNRAVQFRRRTPFRGDGIILPPGVLLLYLLATRNGE